MAKNHRHECVPTSGKLFNSVIEDTGTAGSSFFGLGGDTEGAIAELCSGCRGDWHQSQDEI